MQKHKMCGERSVKFEAPPFIVGAASIAGKKEGEGPLGAYFDVIEKDDMFGGDSWEDAESQLQKKAAELAISKANLSPKDIRYLVAGDLLGQLIASSFGVKSLNIPMFGIYGACSTMGESISIASMLLDGGFADRVVALTSSHFASAEKQFRFPLSYGNQRPFASTWTVTGSGAVVLASPDSLPKVSGELSGTSAGKVNSKKKNGKTSRVRVKGITTGIITDYGVKDSMNMGACMAPAAGDVIVNNLKDFSVGVEEYDRIITGDLGEIGRDILTDILAANGYQPGDRLMDCGIEIFDKEKQGTQAGGSGCGCSAITLTGYILHKLETGEWKKVLFVPTGALLSPVSFNEGNSVPGIAHGVVLEGEEV